MRVAATLVLVACGRAVDGGPPVVSAEPVPTAADTDCQDAVPTDGAFLGVTVLDVDGVPLGADAAEVRYCRDGRCAEPACVEGAVFHFGGLPTGAGGLEVAPRGHAAERLSTAYAPLAVVAGRSTAVSVHLPPLGRPVAVPGVPAEVEVAPGLFLTVGAASLDADAEGPVDALAGVDATDLALPVHGVEGEVIAVYHLAPFGLRPREPLAVRVADRWHLGRRPATLWVGDPDEGAWRPVGTLHREADGRLASDGGLDRLATLVVTRGR